MLVVWLQAMARGDDDVLLRWPRVQAWEGGGEGEGEGEGEGGLNGSRARAKSRAWNVYVL